MATATTAQRSVTPTNEPSREQITRNAEEIRRFWTPAECHRRREQARSAQQRLFCLAFTLAA